MGILEALFPFMVFSFFISLCIASYRLVRGPTAPDRVIAGDVMVNVTIVLLVLLSFHHHEAMLLDIAILIALLGFIGTLAISKFLEGRDIGD
ncbi:MAG: monovalent cation/H+ antiporter complex subunit F [Candidatus Hecatellaceae archaeon]